MLRDLPTLVNNLTLSVSGICIVFQNSYALSNHFKEFNLKHEIPYNILKSSIELSLVADILNVLGLLLPPVTQALSNLSWRRYLICSGEDSGDLIAKKRPYPKGIVLSVDDHSFYEG
ncbi:hypothetical protein Salat_2160500 [Sesamum alatum]|uniref:Uncharacterized protein n=1 Tax=Sesamum alatum TaxID=300844 RepID=A0AAE1Y1N9_9LAMI|nr:hypothetical protein Salat_2160500 [Sesamum alatum]